MVSLLGRRAAAVAAAVAVAVAACGELDAIDAVHDLRILAVRAEPPEQLLTLAADGGAAESPQPVQLTALVADPAGGGRPLQYRLSACAALDTGAAAGAAAKGPPTGQVGAGGTRRCPPGSAQVFASGTASAGAAGWVELGGTLVAPLSLLIEAAQQDPYHGLDGLRLPVQLEVSAGAEADVGTKLVVFSAAGGAAQVANDNPVLQGVTVAGEAWDDGAPRPFAAAAMPAGGWHLAPSFDPALQVAYSAPAFSGPPVALQEVWMFDYFSTRGGFAPTTAGGQRFAAPRPTPPDTYWEPASAAAGPVTLWLVARDGRGGTTWLSRTAAFE